MAVLAEQQHIKSEIKLLNYLLRLWPQCYYDEVSNKTMSSQAVLCLELGRGPGGKGLGIQMLKLLK